MNEASPRPSTEADVALVFAEAYCSGRFTQLELMSDSELIREAKRHDLTVRRETLEELDRYGAFTPIAFGADWQGDFYGPRWNVAATLA